jgi:hypothetical protein
MITQRGQLMQMPTEDRRKVSYSGLLDSVIGAATKLSYANDQTTKCLANQMLKELLQLRRQIPVRRKVDTRARLK